MRSLTLYFRYNQATMTRKDNISSTISSGLALVSSAFFALVSYLYLLDCYFLPFSPLLAIGSLVLFTYSIEKMNGQLVEYVPQILRFVNCSTSVRAKRLVVLLFWSSMYVLILLLLLDFSRDQEHIPWFGFCRTFRELNYVLFKRFLPFIPVA